MDRVYIMNDSGVAEKSKLYWGEGRTLDDVEEWDYNNTIEEVAGFYDWGAVSDKNVVGSGCKVQSILETLADRDYLAYFTYYTEDELFDEISDTWQGIAEYIFDGDFAVDGERMRQAFEAARKCNTSEEVIATVIGTLCGRKCVHCTSCGFSQGDYAEVYILEPVEPTEGEIEHAKAAINAYLWGDYDTCWLIDEHGEEVASALVLNYTPSYYKSESWCERLPHIKSEVLDVLGIKGRKIGTATVERVTRWEWATKEPEE